MRVTNLNPGDEIGATSWFLDIGRHRILLDSGIHPKREGRESLPMLELIKNEELDAIAISHCHHDHVGSLPVAVRQFPKAHVLMTELSYFLIERVLHNSVNVMMRQRDEAGIRDYPLFSHGEVDEIASIFQGYKYNREIEWAGYPRAHTGGPSPTLEFHDAGHALGAAGLMIRSSEASVFFTGDVSFRDQTILRAARFEDVTADVMIMETTRGNRATPPGFTREAEIERLAQSIQDVLKRNGSVLLPVFALGRAQEILALLSLLMNSGRLRKQPIYIGGLTRVFTEIYDLQAHRTHRLHTNLQLHEALNLVVLEKNQSEVMNLGGGRIFVLSAGMMTENTAAHDMALRLIGDERHAIFFVGYSDPETPGGRLKAAAPGQTFLFSAGGGEVTRRCEVKDFDLTAHANREDLLDFVSQVEPSVIVLGHGDPASREWFVSEISRNHPRIRIANPQPGETISL